MSVGPKQFSRMLELQCIGQSKRIDTIGSTQMNGLAARAFGGQAIETMVAVGNSQTVRQYDYRTQVGQNIVVGSAGYNLSAVSFSPSFAKYHAVGSSEAVYESVLGVTWTLVAGSSSTAHSLFGIDSGGAYVLAVGGVSAADAVYQFRTASSLTMLTAPALFTNVTYSPQAARFIVSGAANIYAFNPATSTSTLLETHPEGSTCTVLDSFYDPMTDTVHIVLRLPSGAIRCTLVRGAAMTVTRSVATSSIFTSQTVMRGAWTRYNGPVYMFSGEGTTAPRQTAAMLTAAAPTSTPEANVAYDPLKATTNMPSMVADSSIRALLRINDILFLLSSAGPTAEQRLYQISDLLPPQLAA